LILQQKTSIFVKRINMFVILKYITNEKSGTKLPVILLNGSSEIWEFDTLEEAERMKEIFQNNSDSNHRYEVKKI
jgi:hypothetical protein